jgi:hypothetical protein
MALKESSRRKRKELSPRQMKLIKARAEGKTYSLAAAATSRPTRRNCQASLANDSGEGWRAVFPDLHSAPRILHTSQLGRARCSGAAGDATQQSRDEAALSARNGRPGAGGHRTGQRKSVSKPINYYVFTTVGSKRRKELHGGL